MDWIPSIHRPLFGKVGNAACSKYIKYDITVLVDLAAVLLRIVFSPLLLLTLLPRLSIFDMVVVTTLLESCAVCSP